MSSEKTIAVIQGMKLWVLLWFLGALAVKHPQAYAAMYWFNIVMYSQLQSKVTNYMNGQPIIKLTIVVQFQAAYRQF